MISRQYQHIITTPISNLTVQITDNKITQLTYTKAKGSMQAPSALMSDVKQQLEQHFHNSKHTFDLPLNINGTTFQKRVWYIS